MFYSLTLIRVRKGKPLVRFVWRALRVVIQVLNHRDVARFAVAWVGGRTFRAFVLWKNDTAVQTFRTLGYHGKVLREAADWLEWHVHVHGPTDNPDLDAKQVKHLLDTAPKHFFHGMDGIHHGA